MGNHCLRWPFQLSVASLIDRLVMDETAIAALARELDAAEAARTPLRQFSLRFPDMTIEDGYRIAREWVRLKKASGRQAIGRKIGLTSRAMQLSAGITEPDYGTLLDDMAFEEGSDIPLDRFINPKVEVELAFILARPVTGPGITTRDIMAATEFVVPAVEIIDSRVQAVDSETGSTRKIQDTIADNAANAGIVLGGRPIRPDAIDLRWAGAILSRNAVIEETGIAAGVLNHPARGVAWLANKLAAWGEGLEAGEILLGGSFTRPVVVSRGDVISADYGRLGTIAMRFT